MSKTLRVVLLVILLFTIRLPVASATVLGDGYAIEGDSWDLKGFYWQAIDSWNSPYSMDFLRFDMVSGPLFENFGMLGFDTGIWSYAWAHPTTVAISSPTGIGPSGSVNYYTHHQGSIAPVGIHMAAYWHGLVKDAGLFTWAPSGAWQYVPDPTYHEPPSDPIPEQSALLLLGSALGLTGIVIRLRRKNP